MRALVVVRLAVPSVRQRGPYLGDGEAGLGVVDVYLGDVGRVSRGEVKAPRVEANVLLEPVEPADELLLDARVEVVDVRRAAEVGAGVGVARAVGVRTVVAADHVGAPVEAGVGRAALEHAVDATAVLMLRHAVVDDDVGDHLDVLGVERLDQGLELHLVAVLGRVQIIESPRHVSCIQTCRHRLVHAWHTAGDPMLWDKADRAAPCSATECDGGGSQTCVMPAAAMSSTLPINKLYHPPFCFHDSQLNP
jgi:hypothetical protein